MKELILPENNIENKDSKKTLLLPVCAKKIICTFRSSIKLDIFSQAVLNFFRIEDRPSLLEISTLMEMPLETIDRVVKYLIKNNYLSPDYIVNLDDCGEREIKIGYIFYELFTGRRIEGIFLLEEITDSLQKKDLSRKGLKLESRAYPVLESADNIMINLQVWLNQRSDDFNYRDLIDIHVDEKKDDYILPLRLYFDRGEVHWKVHDIYGHDSFNPELKELVNNLKAEEPRIKNLIRDLCEYVTGRVYSRNHFFDEVCAKYGNRVRTLDIFEDLVKLEENLETKSDSYKASSKGKNNSFNHMNKIFESLLMSELKMKNETILGKNLLTLWEQLTFSGFKIIKQTPDETYSGDEFALWLKELNDNRKNSAHFGNELKSDVLINKNLDLFNKYLKYFTDIEINEDRIVKDIVVSDYKKQRLLLEDKGDEWSFLPEEIIREYAYSQSTQIGIDKAKFWESVLYWYIHKYGLTNIESSENWREKARKNLNQIENDKKIIERLRSPKTEYVKNAIRGNKSTLGAYAVVVFLSNKADGNRQLKAVLGNEWWRELMIVINERDNHAK